MKATTWIGLGLLGFSVSCRFVRSVADFYAERLYPAISAGLSWIGSAVPFSLEEITALVFFLAYIVILVRAIRRKKGFFHWLRNTAVLTLWLLVWINLGWIDNYYRTPLLERCGIERVHYDEETFREFLTDFTQQLNDNAATAAPLPEKAVLEQDVKAFLNTQATRFGYAPLHSWQHPKRPLLRRFWSAVSILGYLGPFFCETQLNPDLTEHEYPFTLSHETAHLTGVTSEAEANYWGYAFCRQSADPAVRYCGYLSLLPHVMSNARSLLPEEDYREWLGTVCEQARADTRATQEHWKSLRIKPIEDAQRWVMDLFLKSHGVSAGRQDYTGVVSLVLTTDAAYGTVFSSYQLEPIQTHNTIFN